MYLYLSKTNNIFFSPHHFKAMNNGPVRLNLSRKDFWCSCKMNWKWQML